MFDTISAIKAAKKDFIVNFCLTNGWTENALSQTGSTLAHTNQSWRFSLHAHWDYSTIFVKNILCDHCLHDSGLYIQKILTKREMIHCQKFDFLLFLTINSVTTGA